MSPGAADVRWRRGEGVLWRRVLDDVVLLPPDQPEPFALAGGAILWELLGRPCALADLVEATCERTGADPVTVERGLAAVLADLEARGAVRRDNGR
jgi:hypothetical protein